MNNKIIIGVIVIALFVGIGLIVKSNKGYTPSNPTLTTTPPVTNSEATASATEAPKDLVTLTADGFSPATLTIKTGDKVTWVNKSGSAATVNSDPHPTHTGYSPLNLDKFPDEGTLSLTFDKPGTYGYHNHLNPGQKGTIVVQ